MHVFLISVGKLSRGPEKDLVDDYTKRIRQAGRQLGFRSFELIDVDNKGDIDAQGTQLLAKIPAGARVLRMDEHGPQMTSKAFAGHLGKIRDQGAQHMVFLIGGASGYSDAVKSAHPDMLAFGPQTWPHRLVKVMLSEQIYRAYSLLAGSPYHKA